MSKHNVIIVADYTQDVWYTLDELSEMTGLSKAMILELIAHDVIQAEKQRVHALQLQRLRKISRLHQDLDINLAGLVLAMNLMDELAALRERLQFMDKHLL
ncbi:MAG TPA: chaperone modulator CbpM [Gammaproteobacteria bacterium]|jgi:chaperone modulatory protein CbpM|nr:chaperone modulator CbpM [Gammaproteobacteria bacterium]